MRKFLPILCLAGAALAGAVLRAKQLLDLFDVQYGLVPPWHPLTIALTSFSAAIVLLVLSLVLRAKNAARVMPSRPGTPWFVLELLACLCLLGSGLSLFRRTLAQSSATLFIYTILTIASAIALLFFTNAARRGTLKRSVHGLIATLTVFWACYALIIDYWNRAGDPTLQSYLYPMLALLFCAMALLNAGAFFYGGAHPGHLKLHSLLALFFSVLSLGGVLLAVWIRDPGALGDIFAYDMSASTLLPRAARPSLDTLLRLAFIALHSAALYLAVQSGLFAAIASEARIDIAPEAANEQDGKLSGDQGEALTESGENDIL